MDFADNVWDVDWGPPGEFQEAAEAAGYVGVRGRRLKRQLGAALSAAVWELEPGATQAPYHFHHGGEELLIVLRGTPTLRGHDGRARAEGRRSRPLPERPGGCSSGRSTAPTPSPAT